MNSEQITAFLQAHWEWVTLIMGIVSVAGSILNWNWMCDPTGKPDSHRYGRGSRRVQFFLLGIVLIVISIMSWVLSGGQNDERKISHLAHRPCEGVGAETPAHRDIVFYHWQ